MKNDMKKYLSLGVVLAGSALMISCDDGSDGKDGKDGADAITNLPAVAPAKDLFTLSKLRFIVDPIDAAGNVIPGSGDWDGSPEMRIDFASPYQGEFFGYYGPLSTSSSHVRVLNLVSPAGADNVFTIDALINAEYNGGNGLDVVELEEGYIHSYVDMEFTVTNSSQLSLTGTWTASGTIALEVQVSKQEANAVDVFPSIDGVTADVTAYVNEANDVTIQTLEEVVLYNLADDEIVVQYNEGGEEFIYIMLSDADAGDTIDLSGITFDTDIAFTFDGTNAADFTATGEPQRIAGFTSSEVNTRGTFRLDLDSSYGGAQDIDTTTTY